MNAIYRDYNATSPVDVRVYEEMIPYLDYDWASVGIRTALLFRKNGYEVTYVGVDSLGRVNPENLPISDSHYDFVLMVTVDCFLSDIEKAFQEINRILTKDGFFIIAFLDKSTALGKIYQEKKASNEFYKDANFHSGREITEILSKTGFNIVDKKQTIFTLRNESQFIKNGIGEGLFAVIKAEKSSQIRKYNSPK